jgi:PAS domain S-box-containing protein
MSNADPAKIFELKIKEVYTQGANAVLGMPGVAVITTLLFWNNIPNQSLLAWLGLILLLSLIRLVLILRYRRRGEKRDDIHIWYRAYLLLELASGLSWAALVYWLLPESTTDQVLILLILGAMATGAATMLTPVRSIYAAYLFGSGIPISLTFLFMSRDYAVYLAGLTFLYTLILWASANMMHRRNTESISLALENLQLLNSMRKNNEELERQVAHTQRAERHSHEVEERFRTLANATNEGVILYENGHIIDCNQRITEMLGYSAQDLYNMNIESLFEGESKQRLQTLLQQDDSLNYELRCLRKDYSGFPAEINKRRLTTADENTVDVITVHDITELKRMAEIKEQFISTVSHELRTPLTSIHASLGLVMGGVGGELSARARELLKIAAQNSERLGTLINDLLDIQKLDAGKLSFHYDTVDIMELVNQAIELNDAYADRFHSRFLLTQGLFDTQVCVDRNRLIQVITNLLSNAAKFSPPNSDIEITLTREGGNVRVAIKDRGPGIPEEFRGRIFQRFSQADSTTTRNHSGSGLGLFISQQIIEHMHGGIGFDTETGKGTTFFFTLPIVAKPPASS